MKKLIALSLLPLILTSFVWANEDEDMFDEMMASAKPLLSCKANTSNSLEILSAGDMAGDVPIAFGLYKVKGAKDRRLLIMFRDGSETQLNAYVQDMSDKMNLQGELNLKLAANKQSASGVLKMFNIAAKTNETVALTNCGFAR